MITFHVVKEGFDREQLYYTLCKTFRWTLITDDNHATGYRLIYSLLTARCIYLKMYVSISKSTTVRISRTESNTVDNCRLICSCICTFQLVWGGDIHLGKTHSSTSRGFTVYYFDLQNNYTHFSLHTHQCYLALSLTEVDTV